MDTASPSPDKPLHVDNTASLRGAASVNWVG